MNKTHGFSLVELLIALVIGLFISGVMVSTFLYNNRAALFQQEALALQEQGRVSLDLMAKFVRMAGYRPAAQDPDEFAPVIGTANSIEIRFEPDSDESAPLKDCKGNTVAANTVSLNRFKVSGGKLICETSDSDASPVTLAKDIEELAILYGVDTDTTKDKVPNRFTTSASAGDTIATVELCLRLASSTNVLDRETVFSDCGGSDITTDKLKLRRLMRTTVAIRNL